MRTFIENYLHFMKNCIRPHYEKLNPLKSGFIENSNFENNRDPCNQGWIELCGDWVDDARVAELVLNCDGNISSRKILQHSPSNDQPTPQVDLTLGCV